MKRISILTAIVAVVMLSTFSCTKEVIEPPIPPVEPPIEDTTDNDTIIVEDSIQLNGNYILIKSGLYFHQPKIVIENRGIIYQPEYSLIDTTWYENNEYEDFGIFFNGQWYEYQPSEYKSWIIIDTITSGQDFYIPRANIDIDTSFSEQYITIRYLDNQYEYGNSTSFHLFDNFTNVYSTINGNMLFYVFGDYKETIQVNFIQ